MQFGCRVGVHTKYKFYVYNVRDECACVLSVCLSIYEHTLEKCMEQQHFSHRYDYVMAFSSQLVQQKIEIKQLMFSDNLFFKHTNTQIHFARNQVHRLCNNTLLLSSYCLLNE